MRIAIALISLLTAGTLFGGEITAYVFSHDGYVRAVNSETSMHFRDIDSDDESLWVRYDGKDYRFRDAATLRAAQEIFAPLQPISEEKRAAKDRLRPMKLRAKSIHRELRRLDDGARRTELERELEGIEKQRAVIDRQLESIRVRKEAAAKEAERKLEALVERALREGKATTF